MKKLLSLTLFCVFAGSILSVSCTSGVSETTVIQGRIEQGNCEGVTVYVLDYDIKNDPIEVVDGSFSYELKTNPAVVATITCVIDGEQVREAIIPDGSILTVSFTPAGASLESSNKKSVNYRLHEEDLVYEEYKDLISQKRALRRANASTEQLDSVNALFMQAKQKLDQMSREDLNGQKGNYLAVSGLVWLHDNFSDEQLDSLINTLDSVVIKTNRVQDILVALKGRMNTKEGMPFVDFSVESENGTVSLSDYVGKGKYVLADFWASWCTPCIDEMPHLKELYKKYSGSNFTVLGIACYDSPKSSLAAIDANKLPWPQILGSGEAAAKAYGVRGIPFFILFAPDGTILSRGQHGEALDKVVEENLKKCYKRRLF